MAALFIGVAGVGIYGVLSSTLNFIQALTRCGLDITAVKEIASGNTYDIPKRVSITSKLAFITGVI